MQSQNESKPLPSVELSLKYMSWSMKELVTEVRKMQAITDQKLSEIVMQLRKISKDSSSSSEQSPF